MRLADGLLVPVEYVPLTRREMLRRTLAGAAACLLPASASAAGREDFSFVVANDLHYLDDACGAWSRRLVAQINAHRPRPAFCVLAGDLSENGTPAQLGAVKEIFGALKMPFYPLIGNHDYPSGQIREPYERIFPGRLNYRFENGGWQFLALDTTDGQGVFRTKVQPETLAWLKREMPEIPTRAPTVILSHFPLGPHHLTRPLNAASVVKQLAQIRIDRVFCGHWHGISERHERGIELHTGRCCSRWRENHDGSPEKGYFLCRVTGSTLEPPAFVPFA